MYTLGVDLGTNSVKCLVLNLESGEPTGLSQNEYGYTLVDGYLEQRPEDVWNEVVNCIKKSLTKVKEEDISVSQIRAVGLSGQMHGSIMYNSAGHEISNIITWEDERCDQILLDEIREIGGDDVDKSGCGIATGYLGPTVYHSFTRDARYQKDDIAHVLLPTDWLRQRLTGQQTFRTDPSNGSSSGFFHTQNRNWNFNLIEKLGLPAGIFPEVAPAELVDGSICREVSSCTSLEEGIPVIIGGGDQPMSMIGSGISQKSETMLVNIGTGSQVSVVGDYHKEKETIVFCFPQSGFSLLGAALSGGAALQWWRNISEECASMFGVKNFGGNIYSMMDKIAGSVCPGSDGLTFIPFLNGTRVNPDLTASFTGIRRNHTYGNMIKAVMEGVVFELYHLSLKIGDYSSNTRLMGAGGGLSSSLWKQITADIFGKELKSALYKEQAASGAALMAGVEIGVYSDVNEACGKVKYSEEVTEPIEQNVDIYRQIYRNQYISGFTDPI
ncbi:hypothetical protein GF312_20745 [Candidatus Poribacteria bacterium]|nr:hypothetical protein [Candidatus Poribacteria bacterium]